MERNMGPWPCDPKQHISDLVHHCYNCGMRYLVISPGSRNAPLIRAFAELGKVKLLSIVDERSAAFVALGLAGQLGKPVGLLCTSGSAPLNYAPALAEAYYQRIPLIVLSADRPARLVNHQDSQAINQVNLFANYIRGSYQLVEEPTSRAGLQTVALTVAQAFQRACTIQPGPVQINIPLEEPLYNGPIVESPYVKTPKLEPAVFNELHENFWQQFMAEWESAQRRMIVVGQLPLGHELSELIKFFEHDPSVVIVAENLANLHLHSAIYNPDTALLHSEAKASYAPDFLISLGGHVVSKQLKLLLRNHPPRQHYRIDPAGAGIDTYHCLTDEVVQDYSHFFAQFIRHSPGSINDSGYNKLWHQQFPEPTDPEYCLIRDLIAALPANSTVHLGNSMAVRHAGKLASRSELIYHGNRGVAGIDGCLSTAVGAAHASEDLVLCFLGDLSFLYDSNGLWSRDLPANLRVVVLNNSGGDIFRRLPGPKRSPGYQEYFVAHHPVDIKALTAAYGVCYHGCREDDYGTQIAPFLAPSATARLLEITIDASHRDAL